MKQYELIKQKFCREELKNLLYDQEYTYRDLQNMFGFNERLFSLLAQEYNIPKNYKAISKNSNAFHKLNLNLNHILHLYLDLNKSLREIGKFYKTTHKSIGDFLRKNNVDIRSGYSKIYYETRRKNFCIYGELDSSGYVLMNVCGKKVREHRYIMSQFLNRDLTEDEYVHHIDFNKTNNDINNLFLFDSNGNEVHKLYHGYIENNVYISPIEYLDYYNKNIKNTYDDFNWMYEQYIHKRKSCNEISKELNISRQAIVNKLKNLNIYELRTPTINQYV